MTTITLAGNFIDLTDFAVPDENGDTRGWGHLQLVKDVNEIEAQAPIDFWKNATLAAGPLYAFIFGTWEFPSVGILGSERSHGNSSNTPNYQVDGRYGEVVIDVTYEGSDRTEEDVWAL